jgi:hypothetical protein
VQHQSELIGITEGSRKAAEIPGRHDQSGLEFNRKVLVASVFTVDAATRGFATLVELATSAAGVDASCLLTGTGHLKNVIYITQRIAMAMIARAQLVCCLLGFQPAGNIRSWVPRVKMQNQTIINPMKKYQLYM